MIAVDTSSVIAYFAGDDGSDVVVLEYALSDQTVVLPPVVLAELLSAPNLDQEVALALTDLPTLDILNGYWVRVGSTRANVLRGGNRARLADTLIAQSCIDHDVPLITRDHDFRHFVSFGLRVME